ncbi:MAG: 30S ribosomal protein S16 [Ignavibacteriales bacterium]|nr:30S ribosomal protein S16 [Ignavibacteriales bacterium]
MAVKLRLRRMGKKKQPIYKVVAADARSPRDGKFLEAVGIYNPLTNPHTIDLKEDRINYWLDNGAQPTDTVKSLFNQTGINLKRDIAKRKLPAEKAEALLKNWQDSKEASAQKKSVKKKKKADTQEAKTEQPA